MMKYFHILSLLFLALPALSQVKLEALLIDQETKRPVPYASIGVIGSAKGTSSNINGQFTLTIDLHDKVKISCIGYNSIELTSPFPEVIYLQPSVTQLEEIIVTNKKMNAGRIVQKALASVKDNCLQTSFNQTFFYRHYCKDNDTYGRLIEASVEVFKENGYKPRRTKPGQQEGIRVNQLRRSVDKTVYAMGHVPIAINSILESDINAYRHVLPTNRVDFFSDVSNLSSDFNAYTFSFIGITKLDGEEVYVLDFQFKQDSVVTTQGIKYLPSQKGSLYITTKQYAFVKTDFIKYWEADTTQTTTYYKKYNNFYFPYHIIRNGKSIARDGSSHNFHIEFVSTEIETKNTRFFDSKEPSKYELIQIPYDSLFWSSQNFLKATPLENKIVADLGGGKSLQEQFSTYRASQIDYINQGKLGDEGYRWFTESNSKLPKFVLFWRSACLSCIEDIKTLYQQKYNDNLIVLTVSVDRDSAAWRKVLNTFNWKSNSSLRHLWISNESELIKELNVQELPKFVWYDKQGRVVLRNASKPNSYTWKEEFEKVINRGDK